MNKAIGPVSQVRSFSGQAELPCHDWLFPSVVLFPAPVPAIMQTLVAAAHENYRRAIAHLDEIGRLPPDWDGYGALAISDHALNSVRGFLAASYNFPLPEITPKTNGTLAIEWQGYNEEAYIEVGQTRLSGFVRPRVGPTYYLQISTEQANYTLPALIHALLTLPSQNTMPIASVSVDPSITPDG